MRCLHRIVVAAAVFVAAIGFACGQPPIDPKRPVLLASHLLGDDDRMATLIAFSKNGSKLHFRTARSVASLDLATKEVSRLFDITSFEIMAPWPDGESVVIASENGITRRDFAGGPERSLVKFNELKPACVAASTKHVAIGCMDGNVVVWRHDTGAMYYRDRPLGHLKYPPPVHSITFNRDANRLAAAEANRKMWVWNLDAKEQIADIHEPKGFWKSPRVMVGFALSGDGKLAVTCGWHGRLKLWDVRAERENELEEELASLPYPSDGYFAVALSPDDKLAAGGCIEGYVNVWNLKGNRLAHHLKQGGHVTSVAFGPDSRLVAAANHHGLVSVWQLPK